MKKIPKSVENLDDNQFDMQQGFGYPEPVRYLADGAALLYSGKEFCVLTDRKGAAFAVYIEPHTADLTIKPL